MLFRFLKTPALGIACGISFFAGLSSADDSPTFRGPNRDSVYNSKKLLQQWPDEGPKLVWESQGAGRGYASVAIAGKKFYTLGDGLSTAAEGDKDEYLTCGDLATGKQLWKTKTGEAWKDRQESWQSSRSTPSIDGTSVYVITPYGLLICCDTQTGSVKWRKDLKKDLGGSKADSWGYSESPLIDGDKLICTPGGDKATMVALNKSTGELAWSCSRSNDRGAGHASVVISNVKGQKVYVQTTGSGGLGVSSDGRLLWEFPFDKTTAVIPTPIVRDDLVYIPVGYGRGSALLKQVPGQDGSVSVETIYGLNVKLSNKHGGAVLVGNNIYCDSDDKGIPICADLMTGEIKWTNRGPGKGSAAVIAGDGMLYIQFADGTLALAEVNPVEFKIVSTMKLPESGPRPSWAHPVIVDGKLYIRQQDKVLCYDIGA